MKQWIFVGLLCIATALLPHPEWFAIMATLLVAWIVFIESKKKEVIDDKYPDIIKKLENRITSLENKTGFVRRQ